MKWKVWRRVVGVGMGFVMGCVGVLTGVMGIVGQEQVVALTDQQEEMFSGNNILFFDPDGKKFEVDVTEQGGGSGGGSRDGGSGEFGEGGDFADCEGLSSESNKDYAGRNILSEKQIENIRKYQKVYEAAGDMYDVPWQFLAVLHIREHSQRTDNPINGQGIYQLYSWWKKFGRSYVEAGGFEGQTKLAAKYLKDKEIGKGMTFLRKNSSAAEIQKAFFMYNGMAKVYIQQAMNLGATREEAAIGYGSPYVNNKADEKRDPGKNGSKWGQIKTDGGGISYPANGDYGAFVMYRAITGMSATGNCNNTTGDGRSIAEVAKRLAYPTIKESKSRIAKPEYRKAIDKYGVAGHRGDDCGVFVGTIMRASGADGNFPKMSTSIQMDYLKKNSGAGGKYIQIQNNNNVGNLQPGDILIVTAGGGFAYGHIIMYVGVVNGKHMSASASLNERVGGLGQIEMNLKYQNKKDYKIFRLKG